MISLSEDSSVRVDDRVLDISKRCLIFGWSIKSSELGNIEGIQAGRDNTNNLRNSDQPGLYGTVIGKTSASPVSVTIIPRCCNESTHDWEWPWKRNEAEDHLQVSSPCVGSVGGSVEDFVNDISISEFLEDVTKNENYPSDEGTGTIVPPVDAVP